MHNLRLSIIQIELIQQIEVLFTEEQRGFSKIIKLKIERFTFGNCGVSAPSVTASGGEGV